jgi:hypothetical protein
MPEDILLLNRPPDPARGPAPVETEYERACSDAERAAKIAARKRRDAAAIP